jgi:hypothetical protein
VTLPLALAAPRLHATIEARCQQLVTTYPTLCIRSVIGHGNETPQRDISCLRIGHGNERPVAVIVGGVHGREWAPPDAVLNFAEALLEAYTASTEITYPAATIETGGTTLTHPAYAIPTADVRDIIDKVDLYVVPLLNPDGRDFDITHPDVLWRKNRRPAADPADVGVDLNRNFDIAWRFEDYYDMGVYRQRYAGDPASTSNDPASDTLSSELFRGPQPYSPEPETEALQTLINAHDVRLYIDVHMFGRNFLWCWGIDENGADVAKTWRNATFDGHRDGLIAADAVAAGLSVDYQEWCPPAVATRLRDLARAMHDEVIRSGGGDPAAPRNPLTASSSYTSDVQSAFLYLPTGGGPTPGCSDDYAFSRQLTTPGHGPTYSFTIEAGSTAEGGFHPTYTAPSGHPNRVHYPKIEREIHAALKTALVSLARPAPAQAAGTPAVMDEILQFFGLATPAPVTVEGRNVLRFPDADPPAVRHGVLAHREGGLVTDASLRPRVCVLLGPGATFQGIADRVLPLYAAAAAGGSAPPSRDELARALVVYNQYHLPAGTWTEHNIGLRLPLPIEIEAGTGNWILNADDVRAWATAFDGSWLARLTSPPEPLGMPEPLSRLPQEAAAVRAAHPTPLELAVHLQARILRNPFADVFLVLEILRELGADTVEVVLSLLDVSVDHQARVLASTTAGNALLRRFAAVLAGAPASTDPARLARARGLLDQGLFQGPAGSRTHVAPRELPETAGQLADRGPLGAGVANDARGGRHRVVLARDVAVGRVREESISGVRYRGPAYAGRMPPQAFITADDARLNPGADGRIAARLVIIAGIAANEGNLDAVRQRDRGVISSGIHQWSAHAPNELPSLLFRFKTLAPDEFDLYFGIYGLDVDADPAHPGQFRLLRVEPDDSRTVMAYAAIRTFFGGSVGADGVVSFETTWAARMRAAAVASEAYRRCQVLEAVGRFDRILAEIGAVHAGGADVALAQLISSRRGVALILDSHINVPGHVHDELETAALPNVPADADGRERTITQRYHDHRTVFDRTHRNAGVDAQHFDPAHGSFTGW